MFRVKVTVKQLGKKRERFSKQNFCLRKKPYTVKELIEQTVFTCVDQYNARLAQTDVSPLPSQGEMEAMAELGKIAFGAFAEGKPADPRKAEDRKRRSTYRYETAPGKWYAASLTRLRRAGGTAGRKSSG